MYNVSDEVFQWLTAYAQRNRRSVIRQVETIIENAMKEDIKKQQADKK
jgi:predicted Fe-S protein YdhL (DUF1289 family)